MLVSEAEAAKKQCPYVSTLANDAAHGYMPVRCSGSECMGWRWTNKFREPFCQGEGAHPTVRLGYCGAAGAIVE